MTITTMKNTLEGTARPQTRERSGRESRVLASGFAKRVWKADGSRLTKIAIGSGWARFGMFN